ncbi:MAG: tetratricopeptide repeat protein [Bacteroidota bacterium]
MGSPKKNKKAVRQESVKKTSEITFGKLTLIIGVVLLVTCLCYIPSLHNDFLKYWDDQAYVTNNDLIKDLSANSIKRIFKEDAGLYANYHPLTTLSLALNYHEGVTSFPFHLTNLFLHLLNTLLVFVFIFLLSNKKVLVAVLTALWFGIHPMHVESVSWISERKDLLYTFFYLLSLISYWQYVKKDLALKFYLLAFVLFSFSVLSKAMAVSLPIVLLLIDYWMGRKFSMRLLLEKLPFIALSVILGMYAVTIQTEGGATQSVSFPFFNKVLHAGYGFTMYIVKLFVPTNLSAFYPYPYPLVNSGWVISAIPPVLYLTFLVSIIIVGFAFYLHVRKKPFAKIFIFGSGFYLASIALVLQYIPVGRAIMADRYSYIPYIGLFFIVGELLYHFLFSDNNKKKQLGKLLTAAAIVYSVIFCFLTVKQIKAWKNDGTLWSNVIDNYPNDNRIVLPYFNRASYYLEKNNYDLALNDFLMIAKYDPKDVMTLERIGRVYGQNKNDLGNAILYFEKAFRLNPQSSDALRGLSTAHGIKGNYAKALEYSLKAIDLFPADPSLYMNAATSYQFLGNAAKAEEYKKKSDELSK